MMNHTINDLWNGNIAPCEHCGAHDPEANQMTVLLDRHYDGLREGLTAAQRETLQNYADCWDEYLLHMMELAFCDGFILGSRLAIEVLI